MRPPRDLQEPPRAIKPENRDQNNPPPGPKLEAFWRLCWPYVPPKGHPKCIQFFEFGGLD
eukprot:10374152-Karenia_brevis.AAC.1